MAGKGKKAPSAAQLAARARFAAMARSQRGAVAFGGSTSSPTRRGFGSAIRQAFHRVSWGVAALSAIAGYFLPSTLSSLGVGELAYQYVPGWQPINDALWNAVNDAGVPSSSNPWGYGGIVGLGKLAGVSYWGKTVYDFQKTGKIGQGALNVGLPFALGLILDGPELSPMAGGVSGGEWMSGGSSPAPMLAQGGVTW